MKYLVLFGCCYLLATAAYSIVFIFAWLGEVTSVFRWVLERHEGLWINVVVAAVMAYLIKQEIS
jgi:arginine exporter protein ArgO